MLYITGLFAGKLAINLFPSFNGWIVLLLVIFNPNSLVTAHLVQTETLFALLFITYLYYFVILFKEGKNLLVFSLLALLISLTRPAGMYVMFLFFLPGGLFVLKNIISWRHFFFVNFVYYLILIIGMSMWALNNSHKYGEFFVSNSSTVFHDQYVALLQYGKGMSQPEASKSSSDVFQKLLSEKNLTCSNGLSSLECRKDGSKAYIHAIFEEDPSVILKAFSTSVVSVMLSGGASNFANYFGIENKTAVHLHEKSKGGMLSYEKASNFIKSVNVDYFLALIVFWGFSVLIKILMMLGIWSITINSHNGLTILAMSSFILFFIAEYMFLGQSRWRVPLDPFFIILASQGIYYITDFFKRK